MAKKIYQFDRSLLNMYLNPKHEALDNTNKKVTFRLVKGDSELNVKKQREDAEAISFMVYNTIIPIEDVTVQEWLESKPYFGTKITIYDPVSENKSNVESVKNNMMTVMKVMELSNYDLLGLGYQLIGQKALDMVKEQENDFNGLKLELAAKANTNPELIEKALSENNAAYTYFGLAFAKGIIKEDQSGTVISWGGAEGAKIMAVTPGVKPLDAVVEYSLTTEGSAVKQLIGQKMTDEANTKTVAKAKVEVDAKAKADAKAKVEVVA